MVLPGHLAGGYLATSLLLGIAKPGLSVGQLEALFLIGTLAGDLPDIDIMRFHFEEKNRKANMVRSHREYFTHGPLFWIATCALVSLIGYLFGSTFTIYLGFILIASTLSHLILDSIDDGVMWLWPFSKRRFGIFKSKEVLVNGPHSISYYWKFITNEYPRCWSFYGEVLATLVAVFFIFK